MDTATIEAIRFIVVAALVFAGQRLIAKYSKQANLKTAEVQARANERTSDIEGMDRLVHNLETRLARVEDRADRLADRVRMLEEERVRDKSMIRSLIAYARSMRDMLRTLGQPIPEPPGGLDLDHPIT